MLTFRPAVYVEALSRSLLISLGLDSVLIDFFVRTAIGVAAVLLTILVVGLRTRRRR